MDLKQRRLLAGMTQVKLGLALGVNKLTIQRWENGKYPIPKMAELALTQVLNPTESVSQQDCFRDGYQAGFNAAMGQIIGFATAHLK